MLAALVIAAGTVVLLISVGQIVGSLMRRDRRRNPRKYRY